MSETKVCKTCGRELPTTVFGRTKQIMADGTIKYYCCSECFKCRKGRSTRCGRCGEQLLAGRKKYCAVCAGIIAREKSYDYSVTNYKDIQKRRMARQCCSIIRNHHEEMKDDPEHLSTEFIKKLVKCDCNAEVGE